MPFSEPVEGNIVRIWFSPRDAGNRSHTAWLEIDLNAPADILRLAEKPVLAPGISGAFDHRGAAGSCMTRHDAERRLYYIGWSEDEIDPFHIAIGLAVSSDTGTTFTRHSTEAVLDRNANDPAMVSTPFVLRTAEIWRMWYLSVTDWPVSAKQPHYNIRQATSLDGIAWRTDPAPCIAFHHPTEIAIARPTVLEDGDIWRMWFCHRGSDYAYRIGYAESRDGLTWDRRDEHAGINVSDSGWDSEMTAYPHVFDHGRERYMLYAGNGFGREGMGLAILEQD